MPGTVKSQTRLKGFFLVHNAGVYRCRTRGGGDLRGIHGDVLQVAKRNVDDVVRLQKKVGDFPFCISLSWICFSV